MPRSRTGLKGNSVRQAWQACASLFDHATVLGSGQAGNRLGVGERVRQLLRRQPRVECHFHEAGLVERALQFDDLRPIG
jgi:hypothetical protein